MNLEVIQLSFDQKYDDAKCDEADRTGNKSLKGKYAIENENAAQRLQSLIEEIVASEPKVRHGVFFYVLFSSQQKE